MSYHGDFPYNMIPNGFVSSPSQRAETESDVIGLKSDYMNLPPTGNPSIPAPVSSLDAQSQRVATSAASSGNPIFPFMNINPVQSQSSQSNANPHDLGCPIDSSVINPALLQSGSAALDLQIEDRGSHHSLQEVLALQFWHYQRFLQLCEDVKRIQSRIPNNFSALSTTPAPAAYEQWTPAIAGTEFEDADGSGFLAENFAPIPANLAANPPSFPHGNSPQASHSASNDLSCNKPYPPFDSSNFMTCIVEAGNSFTHDSSHHESQMDMVDIQMSGISTATVSGPSQMSNSIEADFSIDQSSHGRGTSTSETSGPPANAPSPSPEKERSQTPATGSKSPNPSSSDRIPCPINTCGHTSAAKRDMQRHIDDRHDDRPEDLTGTGWSLSPEIPCSYSGCTLKFRRKDRLKRHEGKHRR